MIDCTSDSVPGLVAREISKETHPSVSLSKVKIVSEQNQLNACSVSSVILLSLGM